MKQTKFKICFSFIMLVLLGVICYQFKKSDMELTDLAIINIESLASGEGSGGATCYGIGSIDCPDGSKAAIVYRPLNANIPF